MKTFVQVGLARLCSSQIRMQILYNAQNLTHNGLKFIGNALKLTLSKPLP